MHAGPESLEYIQACSRQGPLSLHHVQVEDNGSGSFRAKNPSANSILFHLDDNLIFSSYLSGQSS